VAVLGSALLAGEVAEVEHDVPLERRPAELATVFAVADGLSEAAAAVADVGVDVGATADPEVELGHSCGGLLLFGVPAAYLDVLRIREGERAVKRQEMTKRGRQAHAETNRRRRGRVSEPHRKER